MIDLLAKVDLFDFYLHAVAVAVTAQRIDLWMFYSYVISSVFPKASQGWYGRLAIAMIHKLENTYSDIIPRYIIQKSASVQSV